MTIAMMCMTSSLLPQLIIDWWEVTVLSLAWCEQNSRVQLWWSCIARSYFVTSCFRNMFRISRIHSSIWCNYVMPMVRLEKVADSCSLGGHQCWNKPWCHQQLEAQPFAFFNVSPELKLEMNPPLEHITSNLSKRSWCQSDEAICKYTSRKFPLNEKW